MSKKHKQQPVNRQKWNKQIKFYHNKTSNHFFLSVAKRGDYVAGHDMTTHPTLTKSGVPKKRYLKLIHNPNPNDSRNSYIHKKLRKDVRIHFEDTHQMRLSLKKQWKLSKADKKRIKKIDRNK